MDDKEIMMKWYQLLQYLSSSLKRKNKKRLETIIRKLPNDCWCHVILFLESGRDFLRVIFSVKGLQGYVKRIAPFCCKNIRFRSSKFPPIRPELSSYSHVINLQCGYPYEAIHDLTSTLSKYRCSDIGTLVNNSFLMFSNLRNLKIFLPIQRHGKEEMKTNEVIITKENFSHPHLSSFELYVTKMNLTITRDVFLPKLTHLFLSNLPPLSSGLFSKFELSDSFTDPHPFGLLEIVDYGSRMNSMFPKLSDFGINGWKFDFSSLSSVKNLDTLKICNCTPPDQTLFELPSLPDLRKLVVSGSTLTYLQKISKFSSLEILEISGSTSSGSYMNLGCEAFPIQQFHFSELPMLRELVISAVCVNVEEYLIEGIIRISNFPNLLKISIDHCFESEFSEPDRFVIQNTPKLECLEIDESREIIFGEERNFVSGTKLKHLESREFGLDWDGMVSKIHLFKNLVTFFVENTMRDFHFIDESTQFVDLEDFCFLEDFSFIDNFCVRKVSNCPILKSFVTRIHPYEFEMKTSLPALTTVEVFLCVPFSNGNKKERNDHNDVILVLNQMKKFENENIMLEGISFHLSMFIKDNSELVITSKHIPKKLKYLYLSVFSKVKLLCHPEDRDVLELESLDLAGSLRFAEIEGFDSLNDIKCGGKYVKIDNCSGLKQLTLRNFTKYDEGRNGIDIKKCPSLQVLKISNCDMEGCPLMITNTPNISELQVHQGLKNMRVSGDVFPNLEKIVCFGNCVSGDSALLEISSLKNLKYVYFENDLCKLQHPFVKKISGIQDLRDVYVQLFKKPHFGVLDLGSYVKILKSHGVEIEVC